jgi:addiction module HigA family antidote
LHLNDDWSAFLHALISAETRFLLIGGHAVAVHAEPRFTEDLDIFVDPSLPNARRLRTALEDFGFGDVAPTPTQLAQRDRVWMLGRKPRRIDSGPALMRDPTNPFHPGEILFEEFLQPMGITQSAFAERIGWTRARLSELIHGKRGVTADTALDLAKALRLTPRRPRPRLVAVTWHFHPRFQGASRRRSRPRLPLRLKLPPRSGFVLRRMAQLRCRGRGQRCGSSLGRG